MNQLLPASARLPYRFAFWSTVTAWDISLSFFTQSVQPKNWVKCVIRLRRWYDYEYDYEVPTPLKKSDFKAIWWSCRRVCAKSHKQKCVNLFDGPTSQCAMTMSTWLTSTMAGCVSRPNMHGSLRVRRKAHGPIGDNGRENLGVRFTDSHDCVGTVTVMC